MFVFMYADTRLSGVGYCLEMMNWIRVTTSQLLGYIIELVFCMHFFIINNCNEYSSHSMR